MNELLRCAGLRIGLCAVVVLAVTATAPERQVHASETAAGSDVDQVAAVVNGHAITRSLIEKRIARLVSSGVPSPAFDDVLHAEIQRRLMIQAAEKDFSSSIRDRMRTAALARMNAGTDPRDREPSARREAEQLAYEDYLIQVYLERKVYKPVQISPAEVRAYYEANSGQFSFPETITIRQILVRESARTSDEARVIAQQAWERVKAGEDFGAVALEVSEGPYAADGGLWPAQTRGQLIADVEAQALALEPSAVSEPFHTPLGWHILRLEEHKPASAATFEEAQMRIGQLLLEQKRNEARANLLADLIRRAVISIGEG